MTVRRWVATLAALPLLAVGCADDPEPKFEPSPSPSPTESTSAADSPKPWEVKSEKGAVAFAKHWIDVFNEAMHDNDTARLRAISDPRCAICEDFADRLDRIDAAGGFYRSSGWTVVAAVPVPAASTGEAGVSLRIREGAAVARESAIARVIRTHAARSTWSSRMKWEAGHWSLTELRLVQ